MKLSPAIVLNKKTCFVMNLWNVLCMSIVLHSYVQYSEYSATVEIHIMTRTPLCTEECQSIISWNHIGQVARKIKRTVDVSSRALTKTIQWSGETTKVEQELPLLQRMCSSESPTPETTNKQHLRSVPTYFVYFTSSRHISGSSVQRRLYLDIKQVEICTLVWQFQV